MTGTEADPTLAAVAPQLLAIESVILGLYLAFSILTAWSLKADRTALIPKSRQAEILAFGLLLASWIFFAYAFGADQSFLALEFALALVLSIIHPALATGFFIILLFLRPWEIADASSLMLGAMPRAYAVLALASSGFYLFRSRNLSLRLGTPVYLLMGFALWAFLSTFKGQDPAAVQETYFDLFFKSVVLFILITQSIRDRIGLRIVKAALIFAALGISSVSIYRTLSTPHAPGIHAARVGSFGLLADPNDISAVMILIFPFAFYSLFRKERSVFLRLTSLATLASTASLLYFAKSRGALLALLITLASMAVLNLKNKRVAILGAAIALLLFLPLSAAFNRSQSDLSESTQSRVIYWKTSALMALKSPLFGVGFGGFPENFERYAPDFIETGHRTAHSSWFLALAETGFAGLALFASLFAWAIRASWRLRDKYPEVFFATLGYGIAMSFLSHTYSIYFYLLLGVVFAVSRLPAEKRAREQGELRNWKRELKAAGALSAALGVFLAARPTQAGHSILAAEAARGSEKPIGASAPATGTHLELSGSRGETLNFQLRLRSEGCVKLGFQPGKSDGLTARFYEMPYIRTQHPSYPGAYVGSHHDPLPPLKDGELCPTAVSATGGMKPWTWVWGEIRIPASLPPGNYDSRITVTAIEKMREIPLKLRVWKMVMPEAPAIPFYAEYSSWYGVLGHFGRSDPQEGALAQAYAKEMRDHRISPLKSWVKVPKAVSASQLDLDESPGGHSSFREVILNQRPSWSGIDFPQPIGAPPAEQERYWKAVEQEILSNQLQGKAFVYLWDEPKAQDYPALIQLAEKVRKAAPHLKILVTTSGYEKISRIPELENTIDIFVPILNDWGSDFSDSQNQKMQRYRELQSKGKELWTYLSCMSHGCGGAEESGYPDWVLDRPSAWIRSIAWLWSRMDMNGLLYYNVDYAYQFYPKKDPWNDLWYFTGNGDGTLFYPGRPGEHGLKEHQPVGSIRLKQWREASFDGEYIRWMEKLPKPPRWWIREFAALVKGPRDWSKSYGEYQLLRDQAGAYLDNLPIHP